MLQRNGRRHYGWELGLLAVAVVWGTTFPIVKCSVERCPQIRGGFELGSIDRPTTPLMFLALRFTIAAFVVGAVSFRALRDLTRRQILIGAAIGLALGGSYVAQTFGLQRTTASNAGFITGLYVVLTPLLGALALRRWPSAATGGGAVVAAVGLLLLSAPSGVGLGIGDALVLMCAFAAAVHILLLGRFSGIAPVGALVTVQLATIAVMTAALSIATERVPPPSESPIWISILITALLASAAAGFLQTGAQRFVGPSRTAVILTMESPFAAMFGYLMLNEQLAARGWLGAGLILAGMLIAELLAPAREAL